MASEVRKSELGVEPYVPNPMAVYTPGIDYSLWAKFASTYLMATIGASPRRRPAEKEAHPSATSRRCRGASALSPFRGLLKFLEADVGERSLFGRFGRVAG